MNLPIDLIPDTSPPKFRWRQVVKTIGSIQVIEHEGHLTPSVEDAVVSLIHMLKTRETECMVLNGSINMLVDRLGGTVEGKPTHSGNFLQRVDELRDLEHKYHGDQDKTADTAKPMNQSTGKRKG